MDNIFLLASIAAFISALVQYLISSYNASSETPKLKPKSIVTSSAYVFTSTVVAYYIMFYWDSLMGDTSALPPAVFTDIPNF